MSHVCFSSCFAYIERLYQKLGAKVENSTCTHGRPSIGRPYFYLFIFLSLFRCMHAHRARWPYPLMLIPKWTILIHIEICCCCCWHFFQLLLFPLHHHHHRFTVNVRQNEASIRPVYLFILFKVLLVWVCCVGYPIFFIRCACLFKKAN